MGEPTKPPPEIQRKLNLGGVLMIAGSLILTFVDRIWFIGLIFVGIGAMILFPTLRRWRRGMPPVPLEQRKKRFVFLVVVLTVTFGSSPFVLHWHDPEQDFRLLVGVSAVCLPVTIACLYWYVFKKLK